jgi:plasmid stabilization system protein ParE
MNKIIWTTPAQNAYSDVLMFLIEKSEKEAELLTDRLVLLTKQLEEFGKSCPVSASNKNHRRCVISKHYSLVYRIRRNTIYILSFVDNRIKSA